MSTKGYLITRNHIWTRATAPTGDITGMVNAGEVYVPEHNLVIHSSRSIRDVEPGLIDSFSRLEDGSFYKHVEVSGRYVENLQRKRSELASAKENLEDAASKVLENLI